MKILRNESGQTLIVAAVFMAILALGFTALALDVGHLYYGRRVAQVTANAAAMVAATELGAGGTSNTTAEQNAANAVALMNGVTTPVTLTNSPNTGNYQGPYVQASISVPVKTFVLGAFMTSMSTVSVAATAIAGGGSGTGSHVLGMVGICSNGNINISNGTKTNVGTLGIYDSSPTASITVTGGSTVIANTLASAGSINTTAIKGNGDTITIPNIEPSQANLTCDPPMPPAPTYSSCVGDPGGSWTAAPLNFGPSSASGTQCYTSLTVGANGMSDILNPGIYVINGGTLTFDSGASGFGCTNSSGCSNLGGNGVFIYLVNGAKLVIQGGANVNLVSGGGLESDGKTTAPSIGPSGAYNGITIYEPASNTAALSLQGGSHTYMNGAIIAPGAAVDVGNGSGSTTDGGIDVGSLTLDGGGNINITSDADGAVGQIGTPVTFNYAPTLVQ